MAVTYLKNYNKDYVESDAVQQAKAALDQQAAMKPGEFQSQWQTQLNETMNKILNREKFSYDLNGDALYQQYKDQYITQGKQAMMDTMGQAAAMTGGYGNSYAQTVGQQTYQGYLQGLNDKVPELYKLALDKYNAEGDALYNQYGLMADRENQDYGRYRDTVSDWQTEQDRLYSQYNEERNLDYNKYVNDRDFEYNQYMNDRNYEYQLERDKIADDQWNQQWLYQQERDKVSDDQWNQTFQYQQEQDKQAYEQWLKEFEEAIRQYDQDYAFNLRQYEDSQAAKKTTSTGGGTPYSPQRNPTPEPEPEPEPDTETVDRGTRDGQNDLKSQNNKDINDLVDAGLLTTKEATELKKKFRGYTL